MDRIRSDCAGLDVHRDTVVAAVRAPSGEVSVCTFKTTTADLGLLRDSLTAAGVGLVAMEATGVYWKPVWYVLEGSFECWLLNAVHMHNLPGRKTDVSDSEWILQLSEHGLVRPSFVPPRPIRELRDLTRYRTKIIEQQAAEAQRLHKVLEDAGIKLASFTSKVLTLSGRQMIEALIAGERDPAALAELAHTRMRPKIPQLRAALDGRFSEHHAALATAILGRIDHAEALKVELSARIDARLAAHRDKIDLLCTIPGVQQRSAEVILAECGPDMSQFPSAAHLASWAGMCPGNNESAGKIHSGRTRKAGRHLRSALSEAAHAAAKAKGTYLAAEYARIRGRHGPGKAAVAVGHKILVSTWYMLMRGEPYRDLGGDYFNKRRDRSLQKAKLVSELERLGYSVQVTDAA